jgi:hypothetical protein
VMRAVPPAVGALQGQGVVEAVHAIKQELRERRAQSPNLLVQVLFCCLRACMEQVQSKATGLLSTRTLLTSLVERMRASAYSSTLYLRLHGNACAFWQGTTRHMDEQPKVLISMFDEFA